MLQTINIPFSFANLHFIIRYSFLDLRTTVNKFDYNLKIFNSTSKNLGKIFAILQYGIDTQYSKHKTSLA